MRWNIETRGFAFGKPPSFKKATSIISGRKAMKYGAVGNIALNQYKRNKTANRYAAAGYTPNEAKRMAKQMHGGMTSSAMKGAVIGKVGANSVNKINRNVTKNIINKQAGQNLTKSQLNDFAAKTVKPGGKINSLNADNLRLQAKNTWTNTKNVFTKNKEKVSKASPTLKITGGEGGQNRTVKAVTEVNKFKKDGGLGPVQPKTPAAPKTNNNATTPSTPSAPQAAPAANSNNNAATKPAAPAGNQNKPATPTPNPAPANNTQQQQPNNNAVNQPTTQPNQPNGPQNQTRVNSRTNGSKSITIFRMNNTYLNEDRSFGLIRRAKDWYGERKFRKQTRVIGKNTARQINNELNRMATEAQKNALVRNYRDMGYDEDTAKSAAKANMQKTAPIRNLATGLATSAITRGANTLSRETTRRIINHQRIGRGDKMASGWDLHKYKRFGILQGKKYSDYEDGRLGQVRNFCVVCY